VTVTVNPAATTTTVTATPNPAICGQPVTLTATISVNPPCSGTPTGTVIFVISGDGPALFGTVNGSGQATVTVSSLSVGVHQVSAFYSGDASFAASTGVLNLTVVKGSTTTNVTATPNPSACGQSVTVCATVTTVPPATGTPTGTVTFTGPGGLNLTVALNGAGQACLTSTTLAAGTITATYNGSSCLLTSTGTVAVTVNPAATTTTVTATPNPSTSGQPVTVCATITAVPPGTGIPTGTVTFTGPGGLNQTVAVNGAGQACFTSTTLTSGTITATYNSNSACFLTSTGTVNVTVSGISTALTAPAAQVRLRTNGQLVIPAMSATLRNSVTNAPIPGQTITFTANTSGGPIVLGTAVTNASGVATLAPPNLPVPPVVITATTYQAAFAGAPGLNPSTTTAPLTFVPTPLLP
jgi:hypothetical protein